MRMKIDRFDGAPLVGHNVVNIDVWLTHAMRGHWELFGPQGTIANSDTRDWAAGLLDLQQR